MDNITVEPEKTDNRVTFWLGEVASARKREKDWRKEGQRIREIYNGKKKDSIPFNILYSNTETLMPALYNAQPRAVVQRRFKDEDPLGKAAAQAGQRSLEFLLDTNSEEYEPFDEVMIDAIVDALLPGRGATRIDYDADVQGMDGAQYVNSELVCYASLKWDRWVHGKANKWSKVPWVAFEHDIDQTEAKKLFGAATVNKMKFAEEERHDDSEDSDRREDSEKSDETRKVCKVWEIWVKQTHKIMWVSPNYQAGILKEEADRLELTGFYPMPEPLRFLRKSNDLEPTPPYVLYENQAKELNRLTVRINRITEALKVRGAYDQTIAELGNLLKADDNTLQPAENVAALAEGGFDRVIWLMPIEKLVVVLQQLFIARQQCKQVIYEITGISDILRGQSVASETATAQEIKNQWGTLRLKRMQRRVAMYARDCLRITLEIAAKRFSEQTFAKMTGLAYSSSEQIQGAQGQVAAARSQLAMTGQQVTPQAIAQMVPQAVQILQQPAWPAVLNMLRDDTQRVFRIDIETNSTVDIEATDDQKIMGEVLQAISAFIQGIAPLIESGVMPFQVAQSMLLAIVRRYRFGPELEDYLKGMQPPPPPDAAKAQAEQQKAQLERERMQQEGKQKQEEHLLKMRESEHKLAMEKRNQDLEFAHKERMLSMEHASKQREQQMQFAQMDRQHAADIEKHKLNLEGLAAKVAAAKAMPKKQGGGNDART